MAIAYTLDPDLGRLAVDTIEHARDDERRTSQTVVRMRRHIRDGAADPVVRRIARQLRGVSQEQIVAAAFEWLQRNVDFRHDPPNTELLIHPAVMVRLPRARRKGDCDDFTMLGGALLLARGIGSEIVTVRADPADPSRFSHVYLEAILDGGRRIPFDASHGPFVGWAVPEPYGLQRWGGSMMFSRAGLGNVGFDVLEPVALTQGGRLDRALDVGLVFADRLGQAFAQRVAVPAGTAIQTPTGTIARQDPGALVGPILPSASLGGGAAYLPWIIGAVVAVVVVRSVSK